jgi:hypothetical protein
MNKVMVNRRRDPAEIAQLKEMPPPKVPEAPEHLVKIANGPLVKLVTLLFWKLRRQFPEMGMTISEHDIKGLDDSLAYNEQVPKLVAEARRDYIVFRIADAKTDDMIILSENNEADLQKSEEAKRVRRIRETAGMLVGNVRAELSQGVTSNDSINQVCDALLALAKE